MDISENPLEFAGFLLALVTIVVTIVIYMRQRQRKKVSYTVLSSVPLLSVKEEIKGNLQILFNGKPIQQVQLVEVKIINSGNIPIQKTDYEHPISLSFGKTAQILSAEVKEKIPRNIDATIGIKEGKIILEPTLLNGGDSVILKMLVTMFEKVIVDGRIAGVKEIREFTGIWKRYIVLGMLGAIVEIGGLIAMLLSINNPLMVIFLLAISFVGMVFAIWNVRKW
jgi:hypothetical protein